MDPTDFQYFFRLVAHRLFHKLDLNKTGAQPSDSLRAFLPSVVLFDVSLTERLCFEIHQATSGDFSPVRKCKSSTTFIFTKKNTARSTKCVNTNSADCPLGKTYNAFPPSTFQKNIFLSKNKYFLSSSNLRRQVLFQ